MVPCADGFRRCGLALPRGLYKLDDYWFRLHKGQISGPFSTEQWEGYSDFSTKSIEAYALRWEDENGEPQEIYLYRCVFFVQHQDVRYFFSSKRGEPKIINASSL